MNRKFFICFFVVIAALMTGCATRMPMPFAKDGELITDASPPIFLATVTIKNDYRKSFQPEMIVFHVEKSGAKEAADRLNFIPDSKSKQENGTAERGNTYFMRFPLEKGRYEFRGIRSMARSFPIIGNYFTPLTSTVESSERGVFYIGHIAATVRERQGNEFKAGSTAPLLDQAIAGASGGTFDVEISDQFATDEAKFRERFPALQGVVIKKKILAPFDRAAAQKWWEEH